jgi:hypothetical protein
MFFITGPGIQGQRERWRSHDARSVRETLRKPLDLGGNSDIIENENDM